MTRASGSIKQKVINYKTTVRRADSASRGEAEGVDNRSLAGGNPVLVVELALVGGVAGSRGSDSERRSR